MCDCARAACLLLLLLAAGLPVVAEGSQASEPATFPLILKNRVLEIGPASDRKAIAEQLRDALAGEVPSISTAERLQYDYIAVEGEAPVTVLVDFDRKGRWEVIQIESYMKQQNPVARQLVAWLARHVGAGRLYGKDTMWSLGAMRFRLREVRDAGEDSVYGITITRGRAS